MITPVNLSKLVDLHGRCELKGVRYGLGSKARSLTQDSHTLTRIDCSGYVRYLLAKATDQKLIIPDGSWIQRDWCESKGLHRLKKYSDVRYADHSRLFIAFITPNTNGAGRIGHVWLVVKLDDDEVPDTIESHGGVGVNTRRWDQLTLRRQCSACFELPTE